MKKKKTFILRVLPTSPAMSTKLGAGADIKVFWFFSSEKNILT
jgi:hypothetical protein